VIQGPDNTSPAFPLRPRFPLGRLLITPAANTLLQERGVSPAVYLARHAAGDWGDMELEDRLLNDQSLLDSSRLLSAYDIEATRDRIWVITEADRSATTILLPDDY
jgi:hypothetical protein